MDDECQYNAAIIYRKLCADQHTHDYVVGRGGLQALLGLVQLRGLGTQRQAAAALRDICSNKDHKVRKIKIHRPVVVSWFSNCLLCTDPVHPASGGICYIHTVIPSGCLLLVVLSVEISFGSRAWLR